MKFIVVLAIAIAVSVINVDARKNWALLIAGSAGYDNYRHQADICHAYQIVHKAGIPDEQIVVMMYDDIADNTENPVKGNIINKPDGPNVYPGVLKDYTGKEVTAKTFLSVLQGDKDGIYNQLGRSGKVINSGPDDYVFVYFADHGAPGILGMPNPPYLKARALNEALKKLHTDKKFAKLVFYVEACESGSVFDKLLPKDINIYVTTAANPTESSYACYLDEKRGTYLGDVFSVKFLENIDASDIHTETLEAQFKKIKEETTTSHVQQYGDLAIDVLTVDTFIGDNKQVNQSRSDFLIRPSSLPIKDAIPSEMVVLQSLKHRLAAAPANSLQKMELEKKLSQTLTTMKQTHKLIWDIARTVHSGLPENTVYDLSMKDHNEINNWDCYETAVDTLLAFCPGLDITTNDFALRKLYALVNLCNNNPQDKVIRAVEAASVVNPLCLA
ncbi:unnamed protein product [Candidula unifasciata]|uniref:Hemoglobinase n=1 Tax=Candidula unifasciata TaxID=100452 RepID=A0A8S3YRM9_9EUPU|nr:unnamed protein product [Candidula unifasciata]